MAHDMSPSAQDFYQQVSEAVDVSKGQLARQSRRPWLTCLEQGTLIGAQ